MSRRSRRSNGSTGMPSAVAACWVSGEVATHRSRVIPRSASTGRSWATVRPVPRPTRIPGSTSAAAATDAARISSSRPGISNGILARRPRRRGASARLRPLCPGGGSACRSVRRRPSAVAQPRARRITRPQPPTALPRPTSGGSASNITESARPEGREQRMGTTEHAVVIAGGGPAGLMLAGEVALANVDVAIVERRTEHVLPDARAGGFGARTVEVFDQRGIADRFLAEGHPHQVVMFGGSVLDMSDFPTRHPYTLAIWQNQIERIMAEWVDELPVQVYYGREGSGFEQDG